MGFRDGRSHAVPRHGARDRAPPDRRVAPDPLRVQWRGARRSTPSTNRPCWMSISSCSATHPSTAPSSNGDASRPFSKDRSSAASFRAQKISFSGSSIATASVVASRIGSGATSWASSKCRPGGSDFPICSAGPRNSDSLRFSNGRCERRASPGSSACVRSRSRSLVSTCDERENTVECWIAECGAAVRQERAVMGAGSSMVVPTRAFGCTPAGHSQA